MLWTLVLILITLVGCKSPASVSSDDSEGKLIGGVRDRDASFDSTVTLLSYYCTATVIAPRLILTASHCVIDFHRSRFERRLVSLPRFQPGAETSVTNDVDTGALVDTIAMNFRHEPAPDGCGFVSLIEEVIPPGSDDVPRLTRGTKGSYAPITVRKVHFPPRLAEFFSDEAFRSEPCYFPNLLGESTPRRAQWEMPDLAVIETEVPIAMLGQRGAELIRPAEVNLSPLEVGTPVTLAGYGCQVSSLAPEGLQQRRVRKINRQEVVSPETIAPMHDNFEDWAENFFFTPGHYDEAEGATDPTKASLCPGDSGGPVYDDAGRVVGIHAKSYWPSSSNARGIAQANYHARLDREDIRQWLSDLLEMVGRPRPN